MTSDFVTIAVSQLTNNSILSSPIFDYSSARTKLLGKGVEISPEIVSQLSSRGITQVVVSKRDFAAMQAGTPQGTRHKVSDHQYPQSTNLTERSRGVDEQIDQSNFDQNVEPSAEDRVERLGPQRTGHYDSQQMTEAVRERETQVSYVENLFASMIKGAATETDQLADVCRNSLRSIVADKDLFLCLGLNPFDADYPSRHSLHVSTVALSIGVALGLDDSSLADLGTGCLIHDVGMLKLDHGLLKAKRSLTQKELFLLADHPVHTLDALACPGAQISRVARIVAYQIHERCDGSGYPRGRTADEIHTLSKIAAVADVYVGLVSNRIHRKALMPFYAMSKLLEGIPAGLYDPKAVRALLNSVSLYPIGSFVRLKSDQIARVVRSTGETYMTPMIELWNKKHQQFEGDVIITADEKSIQIVGPSPSPMTEY